MDKPIEICNSNWLTVLDKHDNKKATKDCIHASFKNIADYVINKLNQLDLTDQQIITIDIKVQAQEFKETDWLILA